MIGFVPSESENSLIPNSEISKGGNSMSGVRGFFWPCELEFSWGVILGNTSMVLTVPLGAGESILGGESTGDVLKTK
jgi:hypothetical protein